MTSSVSTIAVIGPESTGKSTISKQLATHFQTLCVEEYARTYLERHGIGYTYDDLLTIAQTQRANEQQCISNCNKRVLFVDTEMYVMKVWTEVVFDKCHTWILNQAAKQSYALYLLMDIDLPWQNDGLREYPSKQKREELFHMYHDIMINQQLPWKRISGTEDDRLQKAIHAVLAHCKV